MEMLGLGAESAPAESNDKASNSTSNAFTLLIFIFSSLLFSSSQL
jgi:hypothetical protein